MLFPFGALLVTVFSLITCTGDQPGPTGAPGAGTPNLNLDVVPPGTVEVLVGAGNVARCDKTNDEATALLLDNIPGTVFMSGDGAYATASNDPPNYIDCYGPSWGRHKARTRPAIGSLDPWSPGSAAYWDYFGAAAGERGKGYYSFELGFWHIVVLNSNLTMALGSAQELWLKNDLQQSDKRCTIAIWHHPRFTSAAGVNDAVKPAWDDLYAVRAEIVVNAHYGVYERFSPQRPDGVRDDTSGIRQFVAGLGGISTNTFGTILPNSEIRDNQTYGVLKFTLSEDAYTWEYIPIAGKTFRDNGSGNCRGPIPGVNQPPVAIPGGPYVSEGTVAFDGASSSDPDGNVPLTYHWNFGDGFSATGPTPTHTFSPDGQYNVTLTVTDSKGLASTPVTTTATIGNIAPTVNVGPDATAFPGTIFQLTANWSDPGANDAPWNYVINWGDGTTESGTKNTQTPVTGGHGYATPGTYTASVTITDKDGGVGADTLIVTASTSAIMVGAGNISACYNDNDEATAKLVDVTPGQVITLGDNAFPDGSNSDYANCYQPTWGRHKARTRPVVGNHEYQTPQAAGYYAYFGNTAGETGKGWYTYVLGAWRVIVLNDQVPFDVGSEQYNWLGTVLNSMTEPCAVAMWHVPLWLSSNTAGYTENPSRRVVWQRLYEAGVDLVLNGHQHHYERFAPMNPNGVLDNATGIRQINVGTGGESIALPTVAIHPNSQVRAAPYGVIKMTLDATSYSWQFVPIAGQTFTDSGTTPCHGPPNVNNQLPTARTGGPYASQGPIAFDGSTSSDPDNNLPLTYAWTFGDGTTGTGVNPTHTYPGAGTYTVSLTVTDARGGRSAPATTTATVGNVAPTVQITGNSSVPVAAMYALTATYADAGGVADAPFNYTIEWGDGTSESSTKPDISPITGSHGYAAEGSYLIRVSVTDKDGGTGQATKSITATAPILLAAGDIADCNRTGDDQTANLLDGLEGVVAPLGDNAYSDGTTAEYNNCYTPTWGRHKARSRPTSGNHDYNTTNATGYYQYFGSAAGDPTKGYYTYTLGTWYIIVLNSQIDMYVGSPQEAWLRQELAAHPNQCVLAYWHYPRWTTILNRTTLDAVKPLWDALYEYGADVILNGHDHAYQRWVPQKPDGTVDNTYGIPEFAVGTGGGEGLYQFGPNAPNTAVRNNTTFGVIKFTLRSGGYDWQFLPVAGQTFTDAGSGNCHSAPPSTNLPPIANPGGPYTGESAVTFNGSGSSDPDGNLPLTYSWNFGDGSTGTGVGPSHTYAAQGTYTVALIVTDNKGKPSTPVTTTATIANVPPVVNAGADANTGPGQAFGLSATFTDGASGAPWAYTITWGDGGNASGTKSTISPITGTHTYSALGDYVVRVTVTDKDGVAGFDELTVHVTDAQVLVGAGNIARCDRTNDELTADILDGVAGTVFTAGDGAISLNSLPPDYVNCYTPSWGRHLARTRPTYGSMDTWSPSGYYNYFGASAGPVNKGYYSYNLGTWHIIVLNSAISMAVGSAQEVWLRADLAANPVPCTLAMWHHPRFTSAAAVDAASLPLWNALYAAGADVIVNAHYGQYERFAPQTPDEVAHATNGIREFVIGTGGISLDAFAPAVRPNSQVKQNSTYGVLKFVLGAGSYTWQFIPVAGKTFTDTGTGACH